MECGLRKLSKGILAKQKQRHTGISFCKPVLIVSCSKLYGIAQNLMYNKIAMYNKIHLIFHIVPFGVQGTTFVCSYTLCL